MRARIDRAACNGHALCNAMAPSVFVVDEATGFNEMGEFTVPDALAGEARRGAAACPERAIQLLDD